MEVRDISRKIEDLEFQELLRQLAGKTTSEVTIPQLKYASKQAIQVPNGKCILCAKRDPGLFSVLYEH